MSNSRMQLAGFLSHPLALAVLLTAINASKPVLIDDPAYLAFALHLSVHPADPYGFEFNWSDRSQPAMEIVLPPVLPYWLALGYRLIGADLILLKCWLLPFALIFAFAVRSLNRSLMKVPSEHAAVILTLGPGILPFINFMLDFPALALQLAVIARVIRGHHSLGSSLFSGLLLALALQTKYSVLGLILLLPVMGFFFQRSRATALILGSGMLGFLAWEFFLFWKYGQSHFLFHTFGYAKAATAGSKISVAIGLLGHLGLMTFWAGFTGRPTILQRIVIVIRVVLVVVLIASLMNPTALMSQLLSLAWVSSGAATLVLVAFAFGSGSSNMKLDRTKWFLLIWLVIEIAVYLTISPFPAARRLLGITFVMGLIIASSMELSRLTTVIALSVGLLVTVLDRWDAKAEPEMIREVSVHLRENCASGRKFTFGHWGWQYYSAIEGYEEIEPNVTVWKPGDWILLPVGDRPDSGMLEIEKDPESMELVKTFQSEDQFPLRTISSLYAGRTPIQLNEKPRIRCALYRITRESRPRFRLQD